MKNTNGTVVSMPAVRTQKNRAIFDYLVAGAGFAGATIAERLAASGCRVLVVDRRRHVGGLAHDFVDEGGVLAQSYGPQLVEMSSTDVCRYLTGFGDWKPYEHRVMSKADGTVTTDRRTLAIPADGFTQMFERMLDHPNITVETGVEFRDARCDTAHREAVYTGSIDEFFGCCFGKLTYRSAEFRHRRLEQEWFQEAPVMEYAGMRVPYARIIEFKHITGQSHPTTSIAYEFPQAEGDPMEPVFSDASRALYRRYEQLAQRTPAVTFAGWLGTYSSGDAAEVVKHSLETAARLLAARSPLGEVEAIGA